MYSLLALESRPVRTAGPDTLYDMIGNCGLLSPIAMTLTTRLPLLLKLSLVTRTSFEPRPNRPCASGVRDLLPARPETACSVLPTDTVGSKRQSHVATSTAPSVKTRISRTWPFCSPAGVLQNWPRLTMMEISPGVASVPRHSPIVSKSRSSATDI